MSSVPNPNWAKWFDSSLAEYFRIASGSFPLFIEGAKRDQEVSSFAEFRLDGPHYDEVNSRYWFIDMTVAILIQVVQENDIYKCDKLIGQFLQAYKTGIQIYKYGDGDDELCCINMTSDPIRVNKFGQLKPAIPVIQASIEANYQTRLRI